MGYYEESYITIAHRKINIVKINLIDLRKNQDSKYNKLILLTESNEIYTVKIGKSYADRYRLQLLYKNIDYYYIFSNKILFRQIENDTESYSYSLIEFNNLDTNKVIDYLSLKKFRIDITNRNIIAHVFNQNDYMCSVHAIDDKFICYSLNLNLSRFHYIQSEYSKFDIIESKTPKSIKTKILANGIMISYLSISKKYMIINCINNYLIYNFF